jgi:hypothetical protein
MFNNSSFFTLGTASTTTQVIFPFEFPTQMRATPNSVTYGGSLQLTDGANYPTTGAVAVGASTPHGASITVVVTAATQYRPYLIYYSTDTAAFVAFSTEL